MSFWEFLFMIFIIGCFAVPISFGYLVAKLSSPEKNELDRLFNNKRLAFLWVFLSFGSFIIVFFIGSLFAADIPLNNKVVWATAILTFIPLFVFGYSYGRGNGGWNWKK